MIIEFLFLTVLTLLVYSFLIYPLLAILIGSGRGENASDDLPAISFLVPAYNEASVIAEKINNFRSFDYPLDRIELLIGNDGSTDQTAEIVRQNSCKRVRILNSELRCGKAAVMNRLANEARYPFLIFSDANVMLASNAVRRMVDPLGNQHVGAVTGEVRLVGSGQEFRPGEELYYRLERRIQGAESRLGSVMGVDGGMYLIRRELFEPLPEDTILDDFLVSIRVMRSNHRIAYESAAQATECGTRSAKQEFARRSRIAAGAIQLLKRRQFPRFTQPILWGQFISHKLLRWMSPLLFLVLLITNSLLLEKDNTYRYIFFIQISGIVAILMTWFIAKLRQTSLGGILFYFGVSQAAMAVGLIRGILDLQPVQWEKSTRANENRDDVGSASRS